MSDQAFAAATRPAPRVVLRVPMLDYSLGHELLLHRENNPIATLGFDEFNALPAEKQIAAVMNAVLVCSRSWEENKRPDKWVRFWGWLVRKADWAMEILEFRIYRAEGSSCPRINAPKNEDAKARTLGAAFLARVTAYACEVFGGAMAFDQPFGMVQQMYFARMEMEGACEIENEFERQVREEIEQHQADYRREQGEKGTGVLTHGLRPGAGVATPINTDGKGTIAEAQRNASAAVRSTMADRKVRREDTNFTNLHEGK